MIRNSGYSLFILILFLVSACSSTKELSVKEDDAFSEREEEASKAEYKKQLNDEVYWD